MMQSSKIWTGVIAVIVIIAAIGGAVFYMNNRPAVNNNDNQDQVTLAQQAQFGTPVMLQKNGRAHFPDGMHITLNQIDDSRCKDGVVCVWAGELGYQFSAEGGNFVGTTNVSLGTVMVKSAMTSGYHVVLNEGTETSATITITKTGAQAGCYVGGCSNQICSDQPSVVSTCEYREEYACYQTAVCERQTNGQCGWTQTVELNSCLMGK